MTHPRSLLLLLAALLPQSTPSGGAIAKFVPSVPTPASFISDQRGLIGDSARRALDARITGIQREKLGDVGVAIIPSIGDYSASQVGVEIYRTWKIGSQAEIGSAQRNLGVLLLIVPKELSPNNRGECWITTGMGSEAFITDATAGSICRNAIIPHLQKRDYARAVHSGLAAIENRMRTAMAATNAPGAGQQTTQPPARTGGANPLTTTTSSTLRTLGWILGSIGSLLALILGFVQTRRWRRDRPRKCAKCGRTMERLSEHADNVRLDPGQIVEERLKSVDYDVWLCGCGHTLVIPYRRWFSRYTECRSCKRRTASKQYRILRPATRKTTGTAEHRYTCQACGEKWTEIVVLPVLVDSSSSSGGAGGGGGGGGGGSSFGGSGSTSGGGGGSSY